MSDQKPTLNMDQFAILRGLLVDHGEKVDALIDDHRKLYAAIAELRAQGALNEETRLEVQRLTSRMAEVDKELADARAKIDEAMEAIRKLRDKDGEIIRQTTGADHEQASAMAGVIMHVAKIDSAMVAQGETLAGLVNSQSAQTATLGTLNGNLNTLVTTMTSAVQKATSAQNIALLKAAAVAGAFVGALIITAYLTLRGH